MGKGGGGSVFFHTRPTQKKKTPVKLKVHFRAALRYVTDHRLRKVDSQIEALQLSIVDPVLHNWIADDYARLVSAVDRLELAIDDELKGES